MVKETANFFHYIVENNRLAVTVSKMIDEYYITTVCN